MSLESQLTEVFTKGLNTLSDQEKRDLASSLHVAPAQKYTKSEADYRDSTGKKARCGLCLFYEDGSCEKVAGRIDPYMVCDYFEPEYEVVKP